MKVKFKLLSETAKMPIYKHETDAGMDLTCSRLEWENGGILVCHTDVAFEIPQGCVGLVFPRSSVYDTHLSLSNCVGVIDSGYRGEVSLKFYVNDYRFNEKFYKVGQRCGQIIILPYPKIELIPSEHLSEGERGTDAYGSTGIY